MKVLPLSEVKASFGKLVDLVERRDESITITLRGKPVAVILSKSQYDGWRETVDILGDPDLIKEIRDGKRALQRTKKRYTVDELFAD